jgi:hypothetical protein
MHCNWRNQAGRRTSTQSPIRNMLSSNPGSNCIWHAAAARLEVEQIVRDCRDHSRAIRDREQLRAHVLGAELPRETRLKPSTHAVQRIPNLMACKRSRDKGAPSTLRVRNANPEKRKLLPYNVPEDRAGTEKLQRAEVRTHCTSVYNPNARGVSQICRNEVSNRSAACSSARSASCVRSAFDVRD